MSKQSAQAFLQSKSAKERQRLLRRFAGMPPFMAKRFNDLWEREWGEAMPPYSLTMVWDPDDRIFVVTVPELPGCRTHGATYEEAAANAREAIASWVGAALASGEPLPDPHVERHPLDDEDVLAQAVG